MYKRQGYEDKQFVLLEQVMRRLIDLEIDNERFDVLKNRLIKDFENQAKDKPFQQVYGRLMDELVSSAWPSQEMLAVLKPLTNEQLSSWRDNVFSEVSLQALIHGNVQNEKAEELLALIKDHLPLSEVVVDKPLVKKVMGVNEVNLSLIHI